ncbi:hypothetical protein J3E71DRAFT_319848 [Bipolaris maydis]|nr:hypothetical protein J3E71DRAFT_319848 [Bipolaris maydis]
MAANQAIVCALTGCRSSVRFFLEQKEDVSRIFNRSSILRKKLRDERCGTEVNSMRIG